MTRLPRFAVRLVLFGAVVFVVCCGAVLRVVWLADVIKNRGDLT